MADGFVRVLRLFEQESQGGEFVGGPGPVASLLAEPEFDQSVVRGGLVAQFSQAEKQFGHRPQILGIPADRGPRFGEIQAKAPRLVEHLEIGLDQGVRPEGLELAFIESERLGRIAAIQFHIGSGGERIVLVFREGFPIAGDQPLGVVEPAAMAKVIDILRVRLRFLRVARHPVAVSLVDQVGRQLLGPNQLDHLRERAPATLLVAQSKPLRFRRRRLRGSPQSFYLIGRPQAPVIELRQRELPIGRIRHGLRVFLPVGLRGREIQLQFGFAGA